MPKRNLAFFDPKHNEWLYDVLVNLTHEQKERLNHRELKSIKTKSQIKKFAATGNLEKKLILLTKVGIEWSMLFYFPTKFTTGLIKEAFRQYSMSGKAVELTERMLETKTFVLSSRNVAIALSMMSMNCHSDVWIPNMEFLRVRKITNQMVANISRGMSDKNMVKEFNSGYDGVKVIARIVNQAMTVDNFLSSVLGLQPLDMLILNMVFHTPYNYVSVDYIKAELKSTYKPQSIGLRCVYLWKQRGMLEKMPASENVAKYRITQEGILTVGQVANYIVNRAANF